MGRKIINRFLDHSSQNITQTEYNLEHAQIIQAQKNYDVIEIGCSVTVDSEKGSSTFQILGSSETNPAKGIISHTSPIGSALLGHRVGEKVKIFIGSKEIEYTVVKIQ